MAWVTIANVRGPRGLKGDAGDPLNAAGWQFMKDNFDAIDGSSSRVGIIAGLEDNILIAFVDYLKRLTWIGARADNGGPTPEASWHMQHELQILHMLTDPNIMAGITDAAYQYTELHVDYDGNVPQDVLDRWSSRMGGSNGGVAIGDRAIVGGELVPSFTDTKHVDVYSSSTWQVLAPFLAAVFPNSTVANEGKGGERGQHTAARLGSTPALLTVVGGSIPASGSVVVTSSNMPASSYLKAFTGTLSGVHGTLSSTDTEITFSRTSAGSATAVPAGTAFVPDTGSASRQHWLLLDFCKNNVYDSGDVPGLAAQLMADAVAYHSPVNKRLIISTQFVDSDQAPGSTSFNNVQAINAHRLATWGDFVYDLNAYILSPQVWTDTGITPTATDLQQQADGIKPDSLSANAGHLNTAGNNAVAIDLRRWLDARGW